MKPFSISFRSASSIAVGEPDWVPYMIVSPQAVEAKCYRNLEESSLNPVHQWGQAGRGDIRSFAATTCFVYTLCALHHRANNTINNGGSAIEALLRHWAPPHF